MIINDNIKPRIFIDMDGTLAEWRNITIKIEHDEDRFKVLSTLNEILLTPGYYSSLKPHKEMLEAMEELNKSYDVYILSCAIPKDGDPNPELEKIEWLSEYAPYIDKDHMIFVPDGNNKADYIPDGIKSEDYLIDDYTKNLLDFEKAGGKGIKLCNYVNGSYGKWNGNSVSLAYNGKDISEAVKSIIRGKNIKQDPPEKKKSAMEINIDTSVEDIRNSLGI